MATPSRFPQGLSVSYPWQFFSGMGLPNPFYYHQFADDFDTVPATATGWTTIAASTGAIAGQTSGDGGLVGVTTAATLNDYEGLQRTLGTFAPVAGKKTYFVTRLQMADATLTALIAGLAVQGTANPFGAAPANFIWVTKPSGGTVFNLVVNNNGTITTTPFPTTINLANATSVDIGIHVTAAGAVNATIVPNAVGYVPQSGTGAAGSTNRQPNIASTVSVGTTLAGTPLAPIVAIQAGAAAAKTATIDFVGAFRER